MSGNTENFNYRHVVRTNVSIQPVCQESTSMKEILLLLCLSKNGQQTQGDM